MEAKEMLEYPEEKKRWVLYVAEHAPLTVEDVIACDLHRFAERYGLSKEEITEEIRDIVGRGWPSAEYITVIRKSNREESDTL